ncbi:MAG: Resolvase domain protein [Herbinix sp.]|jgi:site-specific DNA recombinase|nr:Resolvase domain protein [Herbinix sp.]
MRIAIYSRKSKWTGKGESIENQLIMCREYVMANFREVKEDSIYEYEDEGFSGKNTQRPQFQKMISDLRREHYDYLVCYKLDRLGRNLTDLVNLIEELNKMDTSFISIKEKFDTSTPIGRAMMFFTGVLAQMEREQIAERVRDNMLMLARSGRWLGGATPLGFHSTKEEAITFHNKVKTSYRLTLCEEELEMVRFIYREFLEKQSLSQLDTYFIQNNIKTRKGKEYQISTIRDILTNPVYCTADQASYDYLVKLGCQVCMEESELDGIHGLISYGKTSSAKYKNKQNDPYEWIIAAAKHKGIIGGKDWVKVQEILARNKFKGDSFRKVQNPISLLSGLLYCSCGYPMRPKNYPLDRTNEEGDRSFAYLCSQKEKSNRKNCDIPNIPGNKLDQMVCKEVLEFVCPIINIPLELKKIGDCLELTKNSITSEAEMLKHALKEKKSGMNQLIVSLSKSDGNDNFVKYIEQQVNQLDRECKEIEEKIESLAGNEKGIMEKRIKEKEIIEKDITEKWIMEEETRKEETMKEEILVEDRIEERIGSFRNAFAFLSLPQKRDYLRAIIEKVVWDGENAHIYIGGKKI